MTKNLEKTVNGSPLIATEHAALVAALLAYTARPEPTLYAADDKIPYAFIRDENGADVLKTFPELLDFPLRIEQDVKVSTAGALVDYVKLFGVPDRSLIFAHQDTMTLRAVFDYHLDGADWAKHRATLKLEPTQPWKDWNGRSGKPMDQETFARFLEEHIPDISEPDGGTLVEAAQAFEATIGVQAKSVKRLANGQVTVIWAENIEDASPIKLPTKLALLLQPFAGAKFYRVEAMIRWSIKQGGLSLWFDLLRPDRVIEAAFTDVVNEVRTGTVDSVRSVLLGTL